MVHEVEREIAGRKLRIETGRLAKQANGAVLVSYGETVILVTACASKESRAGIEFFPLTVDYEERLYAVGRIPGSWGRREGRASEKAVLSARVTDRSIRPLFPSGFRNDVQVIITVLSVEQDNAPEVAAIIGASTALSISGIPFNGPVASVMVGYDGENLILNPTEEQSAESLLHLQVAGTKDAINMVEAGAKEVSEEIVLKALEFGHEAIKGIIEMQEELIAKVEIKEAEMIVHRVSDQVLEAVRAKAYESLIEINAITEKHEKEAEIDRLNKEIVEELSEEFPEEDEINEAFSQILREVVRELILQGVRPDGRSAEEIRPISIETSVLNRTHGSGLFTRGQTQVLSIATLGALADVQQLDGLTTEDSKRFMHHYNFPPFSVGETRPLRGPSRRDIGHGALAERALEVMLPDEDEFPYTLRLVSEVLESNGSSSMASICGSSLALMDAGVPIKEHVAGIAMGLIKEGDRLAILTDIQGMEDHLGDMDFKVAGSSKGINALQMDIKVAGLDMSILKKALAQAKAGRLFILNKMNQVIPQAREELSPFAPRIIMMKIDVEKIRDVIGPGGKVIQKIIADTGVKIDVEQDGRIFIFVAGMQYENGMKALKMIEDITAEVEVGKTYLGTVTRVEKYGAFVEVLPGKDGLVHVSQLALERVEHPQDVVSVGDEILVKVTEIDRQGRVNLSRKEVLKAEAGV